MRVPHWDSQGQPVRQLLIQTPKFPLSAVLVPFRTHWQGAPTHRPATNEGLALFSSPLANWPDVVLDFFLDCVP